jgi:hypothetical protein
LLKQYAVRLAAAVLVSAAVGLGVPAPASAATCSSSSGVSVVVDFHQLGGGVQTFCDTGGAGKTAWQQLQDAGHTLTPVQRQPGFVCRIDGKPASDPCVNTPPADAYWSLWWSDGKSGTWTYSSLGAGSLKVPAGGYVGMSWQGQTAQAKPGVAPTAHPAKPSSSPSTHPSSSTHPSTAPGQSPTSSAPGSTSPSTWPSSASPGTTRTGKHGHVDPSKAGKPQGKKTHGPDQTQAAGPVGEVASGGGDDSSGSGSGGLPGWVAPVAVVLLFAGAGTIALVRRKSSGGA